MEETREIAESAIKVRQRLKIFAAIGISVFLLNGCFQIDRADFRITQIPESLQQGIPKSGISREGGKYRRGNGCENPFKDDRGAKAWKMRFPRGTSGSVRKKRGKIQECVKPDVCDNSSILHNAALQIGCEDIGADQYVDLLQRIIFLECGDYLAPAQLKRRERTRIN